MNILKPFFDATLDFWVEMSPYLFLGLFIAFLCSYFLTEKRTEKHLGCAGIHPIIKASLMGIPLPLCSCGVLPVALALHHNGARKAAVVSFLASTPQSGTDAFPVTWSLLGPFYAFGRMISAIAAGLVSGLLVHFFGKEDPPKTAPPPENDHCTSFCGCHHHDDAHHHHHGEYHHHEFVPPRRRLRDAAHYAFVHLPGEIAPALIIGIFIAAGLQIALPEGGLQHVIPAGIIGYLIAMLISLPMYACSLAVIPIAATLLTAGVDPGVVFILITLGPTTNVAALLTVWRSLGKSTTLLYLAGTVGVALLSAFLIDNVFPRNLVVPSPKAPVVEVCTDPTHDHHNEACPHDHHHHTHGEECPGGETCAHGHDHEHGGGILHFHLNGAVGYTTAGLFLLLLANGWYRNRKEHH